jgi:hypothetical protein
MDQIQTGEFQKSGSDRIKESLLECAGFTCVCECVLWNRRKNFSIKVRQPLGTFKFRFQTAADLLAKEVHSDFCFVNLSSPELVPMLANFLSPSVFG